MRAARLPNQDSRAMGEQCVHRLHTNAPIHSGVSVSETGTSQVRGRRMMARLQSGPAYYVSLSYIWGGDWDVLACNYVYVDMN